IEFIEGLWSPLQTAIPDIAYEVLPLEQDPHSSPPLPRDAEHRPLTSLFHALMGTTCNSIAVYEYAQNGDQTLPRPKELTNYLRADAAVAPVAVLSLIDRLMVRCDANEDRLLDWKELDCAMPLLIEAGRRTLASRLIELDPLVQSGSELALQVLSVPGLPGTL